MDLSAHSDGLLLELAGTQGPDPARLKALSAKDWAVLAERVELHRLGPLLHGQWAGTPLAEDFPPDLRARWAHDHQSSGLQALVQRRELLACHALLQAAGIEAVALKGAWLAWHAYPAAALRPMRDVDLLVRPDQGAAALARLHGAGYRFEDERVGAWPGAQLPDKHYPLLLSPAGIPVELHVKAFEDASVSEAAMPATFDAGLRARARRFSADDPLLYPAPPDMLAHLVIHAAYSHAFDNGPQVLADIDYLLRGQSMDWDAFWQMAQQHRFARGAALVLALVERYRRPGLLAQCGCPFVPGPQELALAAQLLQQNPARRQAMQRMAVLFAPQQWSRLASRLRGAGGAAQAAPQPRMLAGRANYGQWLWQRLRDTARQAWSGEMRRNARSLVRLQQWLAP